MKELTHKPPITKVLSKEVTRTEFLSLAGLSLASIFGMSTLLELLTGKSPKHHIYKLSGQAGYGDRPYGE